MKKILLLSAIYFICLSLNAQTKSIESRPFGTLKFYPLGLVTNSLQLGTEQFNKENNRSLVAILGLRYRKGNRNNIFSSSNQGYNNWKGASLLLERRIYIPKFKFRNHLQKPDQLFGSGVYVAPYLKADYNVNDVDFTVFKNEVQGGVNKNTYVNTVGKINYFSGTGGINIGYQVTLFQYLYLDMFLGGGLRILNKNDKTKDTIVGNNGFYESYYNNGAIETFVTREGVVPNGGISIGVRW
jgi:hypothetical protein